MNAATSSESDGQAMARSLGDLYESLYETRIESSEVTIGDGVINWVFVGGLNPVDRFLIARGYDDQVTSFRTSFLESIERRATEVVEAVTGRSVIAFVTAFDSDQSVTTSSFVVGGRVGLEDERAAIVNWSTQVRNNSRKLRAHHRGLRDQHRALLEQFKQQTNPERKTPRDEDSSDQM